MKNQVLFLLLSLCFITPMRANAAPPQFNGFYAGGSLGGSYISAHDLHSSTITVNDFEGQVSTTILLNKSDYLVKNAWEGALFTGYGHTLNKFYLGGELSVTGSDYQMSNANSNGSRQNDVNAFISTVNNDRNVQVKISPVQFAAAFRPGYLLTPSTLLYGRVGGTIARVNFNSTSIVSTNIDIQGNISTSTPAATYISNSKLKVLLQLGGGLEQFINDHWTVRLDFIHTNYGLLTTDSTITEPFSLNVFSQVSPGTIQTTGNNHLTMTSQTIMLGTSYNFNL